MLGASEGYAMASEGCIIACPLALGTPRSSLAQLHTLSA